MKIVFLLTLLVDISCLRFASQPSNARYMTDNPYNAATILKGFYKGKTLVVETTKPKFKGGKIRGGCGTNEDKQQGTIANAAECLQFALAAGYSVINNNQVVNFGTDNPDLSWGCQTYDKGAYQNNDKGTLIHFNRRGKEGGRYGDRGDDNKFEGAPDDENGWRPVCITKAWYWDTMMKDGKFVGDDDEKNPGKGKNYAKGAQQRAQLHILNHRDLFAQISPYSTTFQRLFFFDRTDGADPAQQLGKKTDRNSLISDRQNRHVLEFPSLKPGSHIEEKKCYYFRWFKGPLTTLGDEENFFWGGPNNKGLIQGGMQFEWTCKNKKKKTGCTAAISLYYPKAAKSADPGGANLFTYGMNAGQSEDSSLNKYTGDQVPTPDVDSKWRALSRTELPHDANICGRAFVTFELPGDQMTKLNDNSLNPQICIQQGKWVPSATSCSKPEPVANLGSFIHSPDSNKLQFLFPGSTDSDPILKGDPHVVNMAGEKFDIEALGKVVLLNLTSTEHSEVVLNLSASIERIGQQCRQTFVRNMSIGGAWMSNGELHLKANSEETLGKALEVCERGLCSSAQLYTGSFRDGFDPQSRSMTIKVRQLALVVTVAQHWGWNYLNLNVHNLTGIKNVAFGGLLGFDDHTAASKSPSDCSAEFLTEQTSSMLLSSLTA